MTDTLKLLTMLAWSICAAGLAWYCLHIAQQITYVTLADGRHQERKLPLIFRLLLPFVPNFDGLVTREAFKKTRDTADRQLVASGFEGLLNGQEFAAIKLLMPLVCGAFWFALLRLVSTFFPTSSFVENFAIALFLGIALFYY
ncbi:MAG: hypothetical protein WCK89_15205 [bacterium]